MSTPFNSCVRLSESAVVAFTGIKQGRPANLRKGRKRWPGRFRKVSLSITAVMEARGRPCGRLVEELRDKGYDIGRYQVRQLMRQQGLRAIQPRSFVPPTTDSRHDGPFSPNVLLDVPFPTALGVVLVGDITARAAPIHCSGGRRVGLSGGLYGSVQPTYQRLAGRATHGREFG